MSKLAPLKDIGVNIDNGLQRMLGKEDLYLKLLKSFVDGDYIQVLEEQLTKAKADASNVDEARKAAHTIKGVAANLELIDIFELSKSMEQALKSGELGLALEDFPRLSEKYNILTEAIAKLP